MLAHGEPEKAALAVIARGLNVRQTEALSTERQPRDPERQPDPETAALEKDLADKLGLRVELLHNGRGGSIRIYYKSLDQLDGVIQLLLQ